MSGRPVIDHTLPTKMIWETGRYVRAVRLRHGMSARAFAGALGGGPNLIYRTEKTNSCSLDVLRGILTWHSRNQLPQPCQESTCWLGVNHDGAHEDHSEVAR